MSEGFAYLVIMHKFSLTEYVASNEEGYKLHEVKLYQKSLDEDNIGCYYCVTSARIATGDFALCLVFFKGNI